MRIRLVHSITILAFVFIAIGIFNLQIIQGRKYRELSYKNCVRLLPQDGQRGKILDRNGELICGSKLSYDIMILPQDKNQVDKSLFAISEVLGTGFKELKQRFNRGFTASFIPVVVAKNIELKKAIILGELKSDYNNIIVQPRALRFYPYAKLACHILGYLNEIDHWRLTKLQDYGYKTKDIVGFGGIEEKFDYYLKGQDGALSVEVDHRGRFMRVLGFRPAAAGKDIQLTISIKIQRIAEEGLAERKGSVIIMDPFDGQILAMASAPGFNPAIFVNGSNSEISGLADSALVNRAISSGYAPGSVFKLVCASAALETGKINLSTSYFCPGSMRIGNRQFACWDKHNQQNLKEALAHSCDVFFYHTGLLLGPQLIHDYAVKFGLSKATGIDLPYEINGVVPDPLWKRIHKFQSWYDGDTANFSIGQGDLSVTPIQIARLTAVFANKGKLVTPRIVMNIGGKNLSKYQKKNINLAVKEKNINYVREDLRTVISDPKGTANILDSLAVPVSGKTGTAQVGAGKTHGWFTGFFPADRPKLVICVFLENNGSGHSAAAVAKQIIEALAKENLINEKS